MNNTEQVNKANESPCIKCKNRNECDKMCYNRLEWGVLEASLDDTNLYTYGLNAIKPNKRNTFTYEYKLAKRMSVSQFVSYYGRFR